MKASIETRLRKLEQRGGTQMIIAVERHGTPEAKAAAAAYDNVIIVATGIPPCDRNEGKR